MFARVYRFRADNGFRRKEEFLIDLDRVALIQVGYLGMGSDGALWHLNANSASEEPDAIRVYRFQIGTEWFEVNAEPDCPVGKQLGEIYRQSLKGLPPRAG